MYVHNVWKNCYFHNDVIKFVIYYQVLIS